MALVDPVEAVRKETAADFGIEHQYDSLEQALDKADFDAVVITTPDLHPPAAGRAGGRARQARLPRKADGAQPGASATRSWQPSRRTGCILQLGFMRRFDPEFTAAAERIAGRRDRRADDDQVATPTVRACRPPWARDLRTSNGMLAEVNSHDWDTVRWLMGSNYQRVYTEVANFKGAANNVDTPNFYDNVLVNIKFESGGLGLISGVCPCGYGYDARVEIIGEKGIMQIGELQGPGRGGLHQPRPGPGHADLSAPGRERFAWGYIHEMEHFVECIQTESAPRVGGKRAAGRWRACWPARNPSSRSARCI